MPKPSHLDSFPPSYIVLLLMRNNCLAFLTILPMVNVKRVSPTNDPPYQWHWEPTQKHLSEHLWHLISYLRWKYKLCSVFTREIWSNIIWIYNKSWQDHEHQLTQPYSSSYYTCHKTFTIWEPLPANYIQWVEVKASSYWHQYTIKHNESNKGLHVTCHQNWKAHDK